MPDNEAVRPRKALPPALNDGSRIDFKQIFRTPYDDYPRLNTVRHCWRRVDDTAVRASSMRQLSHSTRNARIGSNRNRPVRGHKSRHQREPTMNDSFGSFDICAVVTAWNPRAGMTRHGVRHDHAGLVGPIA